MKKTDVFDKLDNVIGNYLEGKASKKDVIKTACKVNKYLLEHPHPHDIIKNNVGLFGVSSRNLETTGENFMPSIKGVGFRCHCGCNVFQKLIDEPNIYKCNACDELYSSE